MKIHELSSAIIGLKVIRYGLVSDSDFRHGKFEWEVNELSDTIKLMVTDLNTKIGQITKFIEEAIWVDYDIVRGQIYDGKCYVFNDIPSLDAHLDKVEKDLSTFLGMVPQLTVVAATKWDLYEKCSDLYDWKNEVFFVDDAPYITEFVQKFFDLALSKYSTITEYLEAYNGATQNS